MPLQYRGYRGGSFVRIARTGQSFGRHYFYPHDYMDPCGFYFRHCAIRSGWLPIERVLGRHLVRGDSIHGSIRGPKPVEVPYSAQGDAQLYGSFLGNVSAASRLLRGAPVDIFNPTGQSQVEHRSYQGSVGSPFSDEAFVLTGPEVNLEAGNYVMVPVKSWPTGSAGLGYTQVDVGYSYPHVTFAPHDGIDTLSSPRPFCDLDEAIRVAQVQASIETRWDDWVTWDGGSCWKNASIVTNFHHHQEHDGLVDVVSYDLQFDLIWRHCGNWPTWTLTHRFEVVHTFDCRVNIPEPELHFDGSTTLPVFEGITGIEAKSDYKLVAFTPSGNVGAPGEGYYIGQSVGETQTLTNPLSGFFFCSSILHESGSGAEIDIPGFQNSGLLFNFTESIVHRMQDIRASSFQSSTDAYETLTQSLDTNMIETLAEIGDIVEMLPDLSSAITAVRKFKRGDFIGSLLELIDVLASLKLQASFSWEPSYDVVVNTLPTMIKVVNSISSMSQTTQKAYGAFTYDFPSGEFGRESSHLVTRTLITVDVDPASTIFQVLGLKKLGLLPDPSSLWDLVPLSFVADWFFQIGARLESVSAASALSLLDVRCITHTYKITSPLTSAELSKYKMIPSSTQGLYPPGLVYFRRELSAHPSIPRNGRYDFAIPSHEPPWLTAMSLLWSFLRH